MVSIVTDELVLRMLAQWGIDKNHVELWHDYAHRGLGKEYSPYAKFYQDYASKNRIMVVSGLPKVNANGDKICGNSHNETTVGWESKAGRYLTKPNIFSGIIDGLGIELSVINDQPWGARKGDSVSWVPRLFLNGVEQFPTGAVTLYPTDPVNGNYHHNVIELNYGICKRQVRIIEGRFKERWIFPTNPNGDVRIKHNLVGSLKLKLGYARDASGEPLEVLVTDDEELIPATAFAEAVYPVEIGASQTFYPDAGVASVDGYVKGGTDPNTWAEILASAGTGFDDTDTEFLTKIKTSDTENRYKYYTWAAILLDTSGLPDASSVSAAILSLRGKVKINDQAINLDYNIYACSPASDIALEAGDYDSRSYTPFSTAIDWVDWSVAGYNDFPFNTAGKNSVSKTGVSKYALLEVNYDVGGATPTWAASDVGNYDVRAYSAEQGSGYKPKLVVTYSIGKSSWAFRNASPGRRARRKAVFYPDLTMGSK